MDAFRLPENRRRAGMSSLSYLSHDGFQIFNISSWCPSFKLAISSSGSHPGMSWILIEFYSKPSLDVRELGATCLALGSEINGTIFIKKALVNQKLGPHNVCDLSGLAYCFECSCKLRTGTWNRLNLIFDQFLIVFDLFRIWLLVFFINVRPPLHSVVCGSSCIKLAYLNFHYYM